MKKSFYIPLLAPIVTLCLVGAVSANPKTETKTASKTAQKTVIKTAHGRDFKNKVRFTELNVDRTGNKVEITFNVQARGAILNDSETMYIVPLLTDGTYKWSLPAIAVQGKLAEIASERQVWADEKSSLKPILDDSELVLRDNDPMTYRAEVDWQPWMAGSDLIAEGLAFKAGTRALPNTLILADVLPSSKPATKPAYTPVIAAAPAPMPASASQIHPHHIITPVPEPIILAAVEPVRSAVKLK